MYCPFCKPDTSNINRIIISRTDKIGDLVLSIPSLYMAREMYPNSKIMVLVRNYNYNIVKNLPFIDEAVKIDDDIESVHTKIKNFNADAFIALYTNKQVAELAKLSGAKVRVGPLSKIHSWLTYNAGVYQKRSKSIKNEAEYNLDLIRSIDEQLFDRNFKVFNQIAYTETNASNTKKFLDDNNINKFILIHPFDGGSAKNLTSTQYAKVIDNIKALVPDTTIVISSAPNEVEKANELLNSLSTQVYLYTGTSDILDFASLVDRCSLFVGASTGTTHIAGALRKQVVAIYPNKPTQSPTRWGLYGNEERTTYAIPDIANPAEDYSKKSFDTITDEMLQNIAEIIIDTVKYE